MGKYLEGGFFCEELVSAGCCYDHRGSSLLQKKYFTVVATQDLNLTYKVFFSVHVFLNILLLCPTAFSEIRLVPFVLPTASNTRHNLNNYL